MCKHLKNNFRNMAFSQHLPWFAHSLQFTSKQDPPIHLLNCLLTAHLPPFNLNLHGFTYNCVVVLTHRLILAWSLITSSSNACMRVPAIICIENGSAERPLIFLLKVQGNSYCATSPLYFWMPILFVQIVLSGNAAKMLPKYHKIMSLSSILEKTGMLATHRGIEKVGHVLSYVKHGTNTKSPWR